MLRNCVISLAWLILLEQNNKKRKAALIIIIHIIIKSERKKEKNQATQRRGKITQQPNRNCYYITYYLFLSILILHFLVAFVSLLHHVYCSNLAIYFPIHILSPCSCVALFCVYIIIIVIVIIIIIIVTIMLYTPAIYGLGN